MKPLIIMLSALALCCQAETFQEWAAQQADQDAYRLAAGWAAHSAVVVEETPEQVAAREAAEHAAWLASQEYTNRVKAAALVQGIQAVLAAKGIQPRARDQVFADVSAWVDAQADQVAALKTSLKLMSAYSTLEALVGDVRGLIAGDRVVSLDRTKPIVVEAP